MGWRGFSGRREHLALAQTPPASSRIGGVPYPENGFQRLRLVTHDPRRIISPARQQYAFLLAVQPAAAFLHRRLAAKWIMYGPRNLPAQCHPPVAREAKRKPHVRCIGKACFSAVQPIVSHVYKVRVASCARHGNNERGLAVERGRVARRIAEIRPLRIIE